jgi:MraZ protein
MALPVRNRESIGNLSEGRMVLTYSAFDSGALYLYPEKEWERVRDEVTGLSTFNPGHRSLQRKLVGSASAVEPDGNGRIQIPQTLRQVAGLEKRVALLGMGNRFEIWNDDVLNQKRAEEERSLDEAASEEMTRLVL